MFVVGIHIFAFLTSYFSLAASLVEMLTHQPAAGERAAKPAIDAPPSLRQRGSNRVTRAGLLVALAAELQATAS